MAWTLNDLRYDRKFFTMKITSSTTDAETYTFTIPYGYVMGTAYATRSGSSAFSITLDYSPTDVPNYLTAITLTEGTPNSNLVITTNATAQLCSSRQVRLTGGTLNGQTCVVYLNLRNPD